MNKYAFVSKTILQILFLAGIVCSEATIEVIVCKNNHRQSIVVNPVNFALVKTLYNKICMPIENEPVILTTDNYSLNYEEKLWSGNAKTYRWGPIVNTKSNDTLKSIKKFSTERNNLKAIWINEDKLLAIYIEGKLKIINLESDTIVEDIEAGVWDTRWNEELNLLVILYAKYRIGKWPLEILKLFAGHPVLYYDFIILIYDSKGNKIQRVTVLNNICEEDFDTIFINN